MRWYTPTSFLPLHACVNGGTTSVDPEPLEPDSSDDGLTDSEESDWNLGDSHGCLLCYARLCGLRSPRPCTAQSWLDLSDSR